MSDDHAALRAWLATHDEKCPICRYSLRGATATTCPECGAGLRLTVASPGASIGPWALCVISFSLGLGFDGVVLLLLGVALGIEFATNGLSWMTNGPEILLFISPLILLALTCAAGLAWFFTRRKTWGVIDRRTQWRIAVSIFFGVGIAHALGGLAMFLLGPS